MKHFKKDNDYQNSEHHSVILDLFQKEKFKNKFLNDIKLSENEYKNFEILNYTLP